jgi:hypothetical protein
MKKNLKIILISILSIFVILGVTVFIFVRNANRILRAELESALGKNFSVEEINLRWNNVEAVGATFRDDEGKEVFKADDLLLKADFIGLLKKKYIISDLLMKNPYALVETNRKGKLINTYNLRTGKEKKKAGPSFLIKHLKIQNGAIDYLDGKVSRIPVLTKLREIEFESQGIAFPADEDFTSFSLRAAIPGEMGTGILTSKGKIKLKTLDTDSTIDIKGLDVTGFKPYFHKEGEVGVARGFLDLDMKLRISSRKINAPGRAVLRDLQFESGSGVKEQFMSIPRGLVVSFLKNHNDQIVIDFTLNGDLDNPRFSLRQNIIEKMTLGIASRLGLPVKQIGESIIVLGTEGMKEAGKGVKGLGKNIRNIFK